jgi:hypothetical protein
MARLGQAREVQLQTTQSVRGILKDASKAQNPTDIELFAMVRLERRDFGPKPRISQEMWTIYHFDLKFFLEWQFKKFKGHLDKIVLHLSLNRRISNIEKADIHQSLPKAS